MSKFSVRFLFLFAVALWFGGYIFFGAVAAPAMFKTGRLIEQYDVAPQMVAVILSRFAVVSTVCSIFMLVCVLFESRFSKANRAWKWQRGFTVAALFLSLISNFVLLPQTVTDQPTILPITVKSERKQTLTTEEIKLKAKFDAKHKTSERIGGLIILCLVGSLAAFVANINRESQTSK